MTKGKESPYAIFPGKYFENDDPPYRKVILQRSIQTALTAEPDMQHPPPPRYAQFTIVSNVWNRNV